MHTFRHLFRSKVRFAHTLHRHFVDMDYFKSGCLAFCCDEKATCKQTLPPASTSWLFALPNLLRFTELPKVSSILEPVRTSISREGSCWSCGWFYADSYTHTNSLILPVKNLHRKCQCPCKQHASMCQFYNFNKLMRWVLQQPRENLVDPRQYQLLIAWLESQLLPCVCIVCGSCKDLHI